MSRFHKSVVVLLSLCTISLIMVVGLGFFMLVSTVDGKEYKRSDFFHYFMLTPERFMTFPPVSDDIVYYSKADDNYGYTTDIIRWNKVKDIPAAEKELINYFRNNGFTERTNGVVWSTYWSDAKPGVCPSEQYTVVLEYHAISVELITGSDEC